jgi:predicted DNA-binding ribbon-helix-helix protein
MSQKYPIGIQAFSEIITGNYLYIDKTEQLYNVATKGKYFFLSRPRRFGKSLLVSTLQCLYEGKKDLFKGLWIEDKWDWTKTNPVIWIPFNLLDYTALGLENVVTDWLHIEAEKYNLTLQGESPAQLFRNFITAAHEKTGRKVVVLIDEYDKPLIDFLDDSQREQFEENRRFLKSFYGMLKPADIHLELVLLTGVTQFSKVSIFSDLNNIQDISLSRDFGEITGINQTQLEQYFSNELDSIAEEKGITKDELLAQIKSWYNGYTWDLRTRVYNPFSLLLFFAHYGEFRSFWFDTGAPYFLINQLRKRKLFDISQIKATSSTLTSFDVAHLNTTCLLFQTGYLTPTHYDPEVGIYTLEYPNKEVRHALSQYLLNSYREDNEGALPTVVDLRNALNNNDIAEVIELINSIFSSIPYDHWQKDNESFYHALIHLTFVLLGAYVQCEVHTSKGRCDALVQTADYIYAFEFKLDKSAKIALQQIEIKGYLTPYMASPKTKIAVGIGFSSKLKKVKSYLTKVM